jgi:hypothetical protein
MKNILSYKQENLLQHSIELYIRENSKIAKQRVIPNDNYNN